jgi:HD-like signal output (HDOD) protein
MLGWLTRLFSTRDDKSAKAQATRRVKAAPVAPSKTQGDIAVQERPMPTPAATPASAPAPQPSEAATFLVRTEVSAAFTNWLFEGNQYTDIFTNQTENEILAALDKIVKSNQSGAALVRRMPGVIPQLMQSLRSENFSGAKLAKQITHDVVLVGAVLRLVNSSFYNPTQPITSIERAVLVLGQAGLRQLITSVAFQPIIDLNSGYFTKLIAPRLWEQGEKTAVTNRMLAQVLRVDPFESFLAGLLQNVGLLASLRVIDQMTDGTQPLGSETFCNALITHSRTLSCSIGKEWHFPQAVITAIEDQGRTGKNASVSPMGKILAMGDYLSKLHLLMRHERLYGNPETFTKPLSATEMECLNYLNHLKDGEI